MQLSANPHPAHPAVMSHTRRADNRNTHANVGHERAHRPNRTRTRPHTASAERRHTFVTLARANGCPLEDVQDAVGHADPATTRRYDRTVASMATHPAGPLLTALADTPGRGSCQPSSARTANRQSRLIGTGRPMLRLITS